MGLMASDMKLPIHKQIEIQFRYKFICSPTHRSNIYLCIEIYLDQHINVFVNKTNV